MGSITRRMIPREPQSDRRARVAEYRPRRAASGGVLLIHQGSAGQPAQRALPLQQLVTLSIYWFGIQTIWGGLGVVVLPGRFDDLSRATSGTMLAVIFVIGAIAPSIIQPTLAG